MWKFVCAWNKLVSSANSIGLRMLDTFTISFIYYMIKSNGPIMHPICYLHIVRYVNYSAACEVLENDISGQLVHNRLFQYPCKGFPHTDTRQNISDIIWLVVSSEKHCTTTWQHLSPVRDVEQQNGLSDS